MANRNEEYGQQRESAAYGRPGSSQDYQQSRGQQEWGPRSQQQGQQQRYQQHAGRDDFETQRYQSQGSSGYGGDGRGQHYDEFGEGAQNWSLEAGDRSSGQQYGAYGQGNQQFGQGGNQQSWQQGRQQRFGQGSQQTYGQGQQVGQSGQYGSQRYEGGQQHLQGRESLGYGAGEQGGRYQGSGYGSGYGYGGVSQEDRSLQGQFGVGSGLSGMSGGTYGSSAYGTSSSEQRGFRGKGPKNYSRSDERIREDLCERLTNDDDIDASDIEVKVEQGGITLEGKVEQRWMKHRAEDIADGVSGVRNVENRIRVERSESDLLSSSLGKDSASRSTVSGAKGASATGSSGSGSTPH